MVFVVDDEATVTDLTAIILRDAGFQVYTFYDGADVISHTPEFAPDAVITDYSMPTVNGLVLTAWLEERYPQCRIMMITGHTGSLPDVNRGKHFTLLNKPVHPEELIALVKEAA